MRMYLINKWIREVNLEIHKAKRDQNIAKLVELKELRRDLIRILDE